MFLASICKPAYGRLLHSMMMFLGVLLFSIAALMSLFLYTDLGWTRKRYCTGVIVALISFATALIAVTDFSLYVLLLVAAASYLIVNALRVVKDRLKPGSVRTVTRKSFGVLWAALGLSLALLYVDPHGTIYLVIYMLATLVIASIVLVNVIDRLVLTRTAQPERFTDEQLPTLSVAIAARNETETLHSCLEAVIASDYPKLEILVLDDCSQDKTAAVIKQFAHDGVRFVQGEPPVDESWLPKNRAYQQLLDTASGTYILYLGVDVRLKTDTVRLLVGHVVSKQLQMASVLPKRTKSGLVASLIQPMRYWWELAIPRSKNRPPVLSTMWIADRKALVRMGGFASVARAIVPEWHLSRSFSAMNAYAFLRHDRILQVTTHKNFVSQWLTAVRTRYPQVHRRPENVFAQGLFMTLFLAGPFVVCAIVLMSDSALPYITLAALPVIVLTAAHIAIALFTNPAAAWLAPLNFPFAVVLDLVALHISMWRYEFGEIEWKGRNVCEPVMQVHASLPPIDSSRGREKIR